MAKAKNIEVRHLRVGDRINTNNGMREVLFIERPTHSLMPTMVTVQCPASPATERAPLGEATLTYWPKSRVWAERKRQTSGELPPLVKNVDYIDRFGDES